MTFTITAWAPDGKGTVAVPAPLKPTALVDEDTPEPDESPHRTFEDENGL
tara:strand:+ start:207 stop:356 length:150 start_codon:yes stop_codon:yes gene_type:complete